ncbi:MAG TPA: Maf family protein [Mobilitalea sp.]|nr:Maf family protein [Mobilitalea sp.]
MYQIILASESPRRKEIMETMGIKYKVLVANVEEIVEEKVPSEMVQAVARLKTNAVYHRPELLAEEYQKVIVIGADTMVFYKEHALGKPKNEADAVRMLQMLSDDVHEVYTGVSIIIRDKDKEVERISFAVCTKVAVQSLSLEQIKDYIATGEPMDKAGAYAIQGKFGIFIKEIIGDYYNVVGFPIAQIYDALLQKGIDIKK